MNFSKKAATVLGAAALFAGSALAQNPSSKATSDISTTVKCNMSVAQSGDDLMTPTSCVDIFTGATPEVKNNWVKIMEAPMKLSNSQSVFVSPSLVTGLYTRTRTKTTTGSESTATAMGGVYLRAVMVPAAGGNEIVGAPLTACTTLPGTLGCQNVDGKYGVILDSRVQTLTQALSDCVVNIDGTNVGTCSFQSTIDLIIKTTSAHTFNFTFPNVGQGSYYVQIWAALDSDADVIGDGTAVGAAAFGLGSMTAESVRLVHGFEF